MNTTIWVGENATASCVTKCSLDVVYEAFEFIKIKGVVPSPFLCTLKCVDRVTAKHTAPITDIK